MTKTHIAIGKVSLKGMSERPEKCIPNAAHNLVSLVLIILSVKMTIIPLQGWQLSFEYASYLGDISRCDILCDMK
jgi:hypothetical protein